MFWNAWKPNQQAMPAAATRPKRSSARSGDRQRPPDHHAEQRDQQRRADQAELLAGDGEDEVGVLLGHEAGLGLRAVEEALAEEAAVADRDPGLLGVVAGAARVEVGVREGQEPVDLVRLEQVPAATATARPPPPAASRRPASGAAAPDAASTPKTVADSTSMVPRSGCSMISAAGMPAITSIPTTSTAPTSPR